MNKTENTAESSNTLVRAKARRKIDGKIIAQMARLVARNLTESEAARVCLLEPRHWFEWKSRAGRHEKWQAMMESFRAQQIDHWIKRMEQSADGRGGVKYPDWRSAAALLKFYSSRFADSPRPEPAAQPPQVQVNILIETFKRLLPEPTPAQLPAVTTPKHIEDEKKA